MSLSEGGWSGPWCSDTNVCFGEDRSSVLCIKDAGQIGRDGRAGSGTGETTSSEKQPRHGLQKRLCLLVLEERMSNEFKGYLRLKRDK